MRPKRHLLLFGLGVASQLAMISPVFAQSASSTASSFTQGYRVSAGAMESPVNVTTRDANGNLVITDGVIQNGSGNSIFAKHVTGGSLDTVSGVGTSGTATAIGNNLNVTVTGNNNTVVVNANQTNNGAVTATTTLNGKVNLDGH